MPLPTMPFVFTAFCHKLVVVFPACLPASDMTDDEDYLPKCQFIAIYLMRWSEFLFAMPSFDRGRREVGICWRQQHA